MAKARVAFDVNFLIHRENCNRGLTARLCPAVKRWENYCQNRFDCIVTKSVRDVLSVQNTKMGRPFQAGLIGFPAKHWNPQREADASVNRWLLEVNSPNFKACVGSREYVRCPDSDGADSEDVTQVVQAGLAGARYFVSDDRGILSRTCRTKFKKACECAPFGQSCAADPIPIPVDVEMKPVGQTRTLTRLR